MGASFGGDFRKTRALEKKLAELAKKGGKQQADIARATVPPIRKVWKDQLRSGIGPDGRWQLNKDGSQPLDSRKLGNDFSGKAIPGGVEFRHPFGELEAHNQGHVFQARQVAAARAARAFNGRGRQVTLKKLMKLKRGRATFTATRGHRVGVRVLPERRLYPEGRLPDNWAKAVNAGALEAMRRWRLNATKGE